MLIEAVGEILNNLGHVPGIKRGIVRIYITPHCPAYVAKMDMEWIADDGFYEPKMIYLDFDLCDMPIRIHVPDFRQEITIDDKGIHIAHRPDCLLAQE